MKNCPWFMDKTILTFLIIIGWTAAPTTADQSYVYEYNEYDDYGNGGMGEMDYISNLQTNPVFISKPINLWRNLGDSMRLPCIVDRLESYVVIWRKDGNMITMGSQVINQVDGRIKLEEERNGNYLVISSAEESDAGEYACEISTWNPIKLIHSVIIRVNPVIRLTPESGLLTVKEGDSATLACHATAGIPSPLITWRKRDGHQGNQRDGLIPGPVNSFVTGNMTHMQDIMGNMTHMQDMRMIPGNVISFDSVSRNQSGYYVCEATQPQQFGPPVTAELQLDVQQRCQSVRECFNSVDVVAPENVIQGEDAILECMFDLPEQHIWSVKWFKDDSEFYRYIPSEPYSSKIGIFKLPGVHVETLNPAISKTTINLKNVDLSTSGSYECEVSTNAPIWIMRNGVKNLNVVARQNIPQDPEEYNIVTVTTASSTSTTAPPSGCYDCFSVDVLAPENVVPGEDAILECRFDVPGIIYSVKWYKDVHEFYRYLPSDSPSLRILELPGVHVDTSNQTLSASTIYLKNVDLSTSGSYKCEVSQEAPTFLTKHGVKNLNVIVPRKILQDDEKYAIAMNVSELIAKNLIQHDNETFDLYVDASKNFAKMIDIGVPEDLLKYLENPEEYKIVARQSAISSSSSASTSTTAPPPTTAALPSTEAPLSGSDFPELDYVKKEEKNLANSHQEVTDDDYNIDFDMNIDDEYDNDFPELDYVKKEEKNLANQTSQEFTPRALERWSGKQNNIWLGDQCPWLKNFFDLPPEECKKKCEDTETCTAINYIPSIGYCSLRACTRPVEAPQSTLAESRGYYIFALPSTEAPLSGSDFPELDYVKKEEKNLANSHQEVTYDDYNIDFDMNIDDEYDNDFLELDYVKKEEKNLANQTSQEFTPQVSPTISIGEPVVGGYLGKFVMLECEVSAWPKPINYWDKDGRYLTSGARHQIKEVKAREIYKYRMILNVTLVSHDDVGTYYCVSKNKMGSSRGSIQVYKRGFLFGPNGGRIRAYPKYRVGIDFRVSMWIKPTNVTGLLLAVKGRRDCVILEIVNGEIIFSVDNGRGPMIANFKPEYPDYLCNGEWHKVEAVKSKNVATVAVDNIFAKPALGPPGVDSTDTNNPLFIGGHERPATLRLMRADSNFEGCIRDVSIENNDLIVTDDMLFGDITADVCPLY